MFNDSKQGFNEAQTQYEVFMLEPHDWVPNNRKLPVVIYRRALLPDSGDLAAAFELLFERNAWPPPIPPGNYSSNDSARCGGRGAWKAR